ncbi:MAG: thioredoxin family protein [Candidatus Eisenbacteria bacterium]|nr:thioredoxin family protein [Candidatus Eisenbacteria bacterium]
MGKAGSAALAAALALAWALPARAQLGGGAAVPIPKAETLVRASATPVTITAGGRAGASVTLAIQPGWHINASPPSPDYMIPTTVELKGAEGLTAGRPAYPAGTPMKVGFDESPISVYSGQAVVKLVLAAAPGAPNGTHVLKGKVRFQACNDQVCLAPAGVPFEIAATVSGGTSAAPPQAGAAAPGAARAPPPQRAPGATPAPGAESIPATTPAPATLQSPAPGVTQVPGSAPASGGASILDNPIARALDRGGWAAFLTLFLVGLALNLTPCVYPMLGVTVSIFGARRAAPPLQVFAFAVLYVLGMAVMYSALGLVAALTGGLFGGFLANPLVLAAIGLLMLALALSMFGLYEFQIPPQLLSKLGGAGATSAAGVFFSGLVVGIFAAPCIGPPVVALLAIVGAKGDPWFGFTTLFTLALGLGAPYLVLGTFSNLLQNLPRSGEWMVWVKKVFGVILVAVGAFYLLLALAPKWAGWVVPAALVLGGLYLGFVERSASARRGFRALKRATGLAALAAGVFIIVTTPARGIAFRGFAPADLEAALRGGRIAMLDFSADWCVPCHELDRRTFTDRRVIARARDFETFKVDLTHYDSPDAERWRRQYRISGVPTIVFLAPDGSEVRAARVEGFLPPARFLEKMELAAAAGERAAE